MPNATKIAITCGRDINCQGKLYNNGSAYSMDPRLEVTNAYLELEKQNGGRPNLSQIATKFRVDPMFVKKIELEIWCYGRVDSPHEIRASQDQPIAVLDPGRYPTSIITSSLGYILKIWIETYVAPIQSYVS